MLTELSHKQISTAPLLDQPLLLQIELLHFLAQQESSLKTADIRRQVLRHPRTHMVLLQQRDTLAQRQIKHFLQLLLAALLLVLYQ